MLLGGSVLPYRGSSFAIQTERFLQDVTMQFISKAISVINPIILAFIKTNIEFFILKVFLAKRMLLSFSVTNLMWFVLALKKLSLDISIARDTKKFYVQQGSISSSLIAITRLNNIKKQIFAIKSTNIALQSNKFSVRLFSLYEYITYRKVTNIIRNIIKSVIRFLKKNLKRCLCKMLKNKKINKVYLLSNVRTSNIMALKGGLGITRRLCFDKTSIKKIVRLLQNNAKIKAVGI